MPARGNKSKAMGVCRCMIRLWLVWGLASLLNAQPKTELPLRSLPDDVSSALVAQFDKFDLVALGEWHNTREDQDLGIRLVRHPHFARKVRNVVVECGNAFYQDILDRYIAGEDVAKQEV